MAKNVFVETIKSGGSGQQIDDLFMVSNKQLGRKKDGGAYIRMSLLDRTGSIEAVLWDDVDNVNECVRAGDYVRVTGDAKTYRDSIQITVRRLEKQEKTAISIEDFLPVTKQDRDDMLARLKEVCGSISNEHIRRIVDAFFCDQVFVDAFKTAPAGKSMHHAYIGGLLEHTLSLALLVEKIGSHFDGVDRDILLVGAFLHDIGKVEEFFYQEMIDYSDAGRLLNHIVIGVQMLEAKIASLEPFPKNLGLVLKHMIVSHHGEREFGSPEPPKTLEAIVLHYLDELDSKTNAVFNFMKAEDTDSNWTPYHKVLERYFYKR
ncbi:MAG: CRISPR-associated endonuclease Cas3'' [Pseudomonadota bacterium]